MKTTKTPILLAALTLVSVILFTSAITQQKSSANTYITMHTLQVPVGIDSKICIVYEDGQTEVIELNRYTNKNIPLNLVIINEAINNISKKGYDLISVTGAETSSIYTFVKK